MYRGRQCELDMCLTSYCRHGGQGGRDGGFCRCRCTSQYYGPKCESRLADLVTCEGLGECGHGGTCVHLGARRMCACSPDWAGPLCGVRLGRGPCEGWHCLNGGICEAVPTNSTLGQYKARCICDDRWRGVKCQHEDRCYKHCMNGGTCRELARDRVQCHCPPGYYGPRCNIPLMTKDRLPQQHEVDNTAITSMTVTIISVSIVAVMLTGGIIYLIMVMTRRRRLTSPFKHRRMGEPRGPGSAGMEFANRMFLQDEDEIPEEQDAFTMEELQPSTNFVNPVYETMFQVGRDKFNTECILSQIPQDRNPIIRQSATLLVHSPPPPRPDPPAQVSVLTSSSSRNRHQ
jgi:hypothetical protein